MKTQPGQMAVAGMSDAAPVCSQGTEGRRTVTVAVHLSHRVWSAVFGQNLLVLDGGAFECLPHVNVLK